MTTETLTLEHVEAIPAAVGKILRKRRKRYEAVPKPRIAFFDRKHRWVCFADDCTVWHHDDGVVTVAMGGLPPRRFRTAYEAIAWFALVLTQQIDPQQDPPTR